jgi:gamma-glutamyl phosphate reductase
MITEHNAETGEITQREMTADELEKHNQAIATVEALEAEAQAKATAREAILDRLGLTAEEVSLLLK